MYKNENYIKFINDFSKIVDEKKCESDIIFCCIGTDRVIGDCLGPITGSLLKSRNKNVNIYGDLNENLTFSNIKHTVGEIKLKFKNPFIIAIDAALSNKDNIGKIFIEKDGINVGRGLSKDKDTIGNIGIKAVVAKDLNDNELNFKCLQNISLNKIMRLSQKLSEGITNVLNKDLQ